MAVALHVLCDDRTVQHVERGEQRRRAMPFVIIGHRTGAALLLRQAGLGAVERLDLVRQANWQKVGGASPLERRGNRTTFLREPCVGSREGAGEASVAAWMGRAIEHRKSDGPGCRGFQIGRRQYRRRRFGEMSASPAVSENPCTFARLLLGTDAPRCSRPAFESFIVSKPSAQPQRGPVRPDATTQP